MSLPSGNTLLDNQKMFVHQGKQMGINHELPFYMAGAEIQGAGIVSGLQFGSSSGGSGGGGETKPSTTPPPITETKDYISPEVILFEDELGYCFSLTNAYNGKIAGDDSLRIDVTMDNATHNSASCGGHEGENPPDHGSMLCPNNGRITANPIVTFYHTVDTNNSCLVLGPSTETKQNGLQLNGGVLGTDIGNWNAVLAARGQWNVGTIKEGETRRSDKNNPIKINQWIEYFRDCGVEGSVKADRRVPYKGKNDDNVLFELARWGHSAKASSNIRDMEDISPANGYCIEGDDEKGEYKQTLHMTYNCELSITQSEPCGTHFSVCSTGKADCEAVAPITSEVKVNEIAKEIPCKTYYETGTAGRGTEIVPEQSGSLDSHLYDEVCENDPADGNVERVNGTETMEPFKIGSKIFGYNYPQNNKNAGHNKAVKEKDGLDVYW